MSRNAELSLIVVAAAVAAMGTALVNFTQGVGFDAQVALTFIVFIIAFGSIHLALRRWAPTASPYLFPIAALLAAIGLTEVFRIDRDLGSLQRWSLLVGAAIAVLTLFLLRDEGVRTLRRYRYIFLLLAVALLLLPLLPETWPVRGATLNGSRLWVRIDLPLAARSLSFQPGEVAKVLLAVFLASYLADRQEALTSTSRSIGPLRIPEPRQLGPIIIAAALAFAVLVYQRDLGASLLILTLFVGMIYMATGQAFYPLVSAIGVAIGGFLAYRTFDHVQIRVEAWLNPWNDFLGNGYQIAQGLFAMGSGSLTGSGVGLGRPDLIPAASTDFVFAAVAEEVGLAGSLAVIAALALLVAAGFGIALRARDVFRKLLAAGLTLVIGFQAFLIVAGVVRLMPVTGITLPFMSYGGSSLLANMLLLALLARISHGERT